MFKRAESLRDDYSDLKDKVIKRDDEIKYLKKDFENNLSKLTFQIEQKDATITSLREKSDYLKNEKIQTFSNNSDVVLHSDANIMRKTSIEISLITSK